MGWTRFNHPVLPPQPHELLKKTSNETKKEKELSRSPTSRWNLPKRLFPVNLYPLQQLGSNQKRRGVRGDWGWKKERKGVRARGREMERVTEEYRERERERE